MLGFKCFRFEQTWALSFFNISCKTVTPTEAYTLRFIFLYPHYVKDIKALALLYAWLTLRTAGAGALNTWIWKSALSGRQNNSSEGGISCSLVVPVVNLCVSALSLRNNRKHSRAKDDQKPAEAKSLSHQGKSCFLRLGNPNRPLRSKELKERFRHVNDIKALYFRLFLTRINVSHVLNST